MIVKVMFHHAPVLDPERRGPNALSAARYTMLTSSEIKRIGKAFMNLREAFGDDMGLAVHCLNEYDLPSAVAKLIDEGYTGYLIRVSNDEASGTTPGHGVAQNELDNRSAAKQLGCRKAFSFYYRNHRMDDGAIIELRARLAKEGRRVPLLGGIEKNTVKI
jgi:hypothetical protein